MGKKSSSAPAAPDPAATAAAQTATNKETAYWNAVLNNVNQITPYGKLTYTQNQNTGPKYDTAAYEAALASYNKAIAGGALSGAAPISGKVYNPATGQYSDGGGAVSGNYAGAMPTLEQFKIGGGLDTPPSFTSTIELSPDQQAILDSEERRQIALGQLGEDQIGRIKQSVSSPYSYAGIGNDISAEDIATQQANAEKAYFDRLNPQFSQDEEALRTRLINQGIGQGSQAYQREMDAFNQMKNDARSQAVLAGQQYGSTAQQQALQRRNQGIQEYTTQRNAPLNEYIGLTSGVQVQNPQFSSQGYQGAQPVDYAGLVNNQYQAQLGQYNSKVAGNNSTQGALLGLGGQLGGSFLGSKAGSAAVASMFSDKRLKQNIEPVGIVGPHALYKFEYNQDWLPKGQFIGVLAQDVEEYMPEAVSEINGFKAVNYDMLGLEMRSA